MKGDIYRVVVVFGMLLWLFSSCSHKPMHQMEWAKADSLNELSFALRYKDIRQSQLLATAAFSQGRGRQRAMALNNLGFCAFVNMQYTLADSLLHEVFRMTNDEVECLVADVNLMKLAQRTSANKEFFDYYNSAQQRMRDLSDKHSPRSRYACSEFAIVAATYFYYLQQNERAMQAIGQLSAEDVQFCDTAQQLYYAYMRGSGGLYRADSDKEISVGEFDNLIHCLIASHRHGYVYFEANAAQALADLLKNRDTYNLLLDTRFGMMKAINPNDVDWIDVVLQYARHAIHLFSDYGDSYQIAGAYRTLAACYNVLQRHEEALAALHTALPYVQTDTVYRAPESVARIREQLSVTYAMMGMKQLSDENRNAYLDILEYTRQDKELESRYAILQAESRSLTWNYVWVVSAVLALLALLYWLHRHLWRHLNSRQEQLQKEQYVHHRHLAAYKRENVVKKACLFLVTGLAPYIDRVINEAHKLTLRNYLSDAEIKYEKLQYIAELVNCINEHNEILTSWIKMKQGTLSLHIEHFALDPLFEMLRKSRRAFESRQQTLSVQPTTAVVRADKALTLFMINTLMDNARKYTQPGGEVKVYAHDEADYVEIFVEDNGPGLSADDVHRIMNEKVFNIGGSGHGFGLMNCRGIIEKYRKTNPLFRVCGFFIDSMPGRGSRFHFRLPKGMLSSLLLLCCWLGMGCTPRYTATIPMEHVIYQHDSLIVRANAFADSTYYCNLDGLHADALCYADSAWHCLNVHHRLLSNDSSRLVRCDSLPAAEGVWLAQGFITDYHCMLDVRNESAIAALALGMLPEYQYNNDAYVSLYKQLTTDNTLQAFCQRMQHTAQIRKGLLWLCVAIFVAFLVVAAYKVVRINIEKKMHVDAAHDAALRTIWEENQLHVQNQVLDNCLSTIKHETIYYPNKIKQVVERLQEGLPAEEEMEQVRSMTELADYYRYVYGILTACAARQLDEVTFRRTVVRVPHLVQHVADAFRKAGRKGDVHLTLSTQVADNLLCMGDEELLKFLLDNLTALAFSCTVDGIVTLCVEDEGEFVRFNFIDPRRDYSQSALDQLFFPHIESMHQETNDAIQGTEYLVCKQIIREHDEYAGRRGCRINATALSTGGFNLWFTIPKASMESDIRQILS